MQGTQHRLASCFLSSLRSHGLTGRLYSSGNKMISCGLLFVAAVMWRTGATHNFMEPWCQKECGAMLLPRFPLTGAVQVNSTARQDSPRLCFQGPAERAVTQGAWMLERIVVYLFKARYQIRCQPWIRDRKDTDTGTQGRAAAPWLRSRPVPGNLQKPVTLHPPSTAGCENGLKPLLAVPPPLPHCHCICYFEVLLEAVIPAKLFDSPS